MLESPHQERFPMTREAFWIFLVLLLTLLGCTTEKKKDDTQIDQLWREGYGYNNPNAQRKKDGLPPVDWDGTVREDK